MAAVCKCEILEGYCTDFAQGAFSRNCIIDHVNIISDQEVLILQKRFQSASRDEVKNLKIVNAIVLYHSISNSIILKIVFQE